MRIGLDILQVIASLCTLSAGDQPSMNNQAYVNESRQIRCHAYYVDCIDRQPADVVKAGRVLANCILERRAELEPKGTK